MFTVKLISTIRDIQKTKVYQCRSYEQEMEYMGESPDGSDYKVSYTLNGLSGNDEDVAYIPMGKAKEAYKEDEEIKYQKIFFMNQFGKTVDSYIVK